MAAENREEVRDFLATRRAKITPEQAGLTVYGTNRRVPGLRREEAALLAGVSVEYYTRLERGNLAGVSEGILEALARALQLDDAERDHLFDLARNAGPSRSRPRASRQAVRPSVQFMLDAITGAPAFVRNGRMDILAANRLGFALYSQMYDGAARQTLGVPARPANHSRFIFLDTRAREFYPDWNLAANNNVALLRTESGRNPHDKGLADLVGELSTRSAEFASLWARHNVRRHYSGRKHFRHPVVGELEMVFEALALEEDPGLTLTVYPAVPGSPSEESLKLLASWAATERIGEPVRSGA
ncbi:helix-turn-helix transcriptional regulator [Sinomonas sp. ASV486]|uniref:Helix-turn-helix transcriptional regulator n=1 Tax=Sinomonas puerhi TaxID=3238584 RepID=A0AB39L2Y7_9MICC|nr:helix-turn-helix transcriptional regulator [Sinomonas sp. ASV486]MDQ4489394.1 helix-turn-helix transcriptional regulator [Sinomonas sp. ASV486]